MGRTPPASLEDGTVSRSRYWIVSALLLLIGLSAAGTAQDSKDKAKDDKAKAPEAKAEPKAAETPPAAGDKVELKWNFEKDKRIDKRL